MKTKACLLILLAIACFAQRSEAREKEKTPPKPTSWGYAAAGPVEVRPKPRAGKRVLVRLGRGALVPVFESRQRGSLRWFRVRAVDPATLIPTMGWLDAGQVESLPFEDFPPDADLLKLLAGPYLDDFTAAHTALVRFLLRQGSRKPALVCFLGSPILPHARLQIFIRSQGEFVPGPFREFAFADMQAGIRRLEVRDLLGDANECLITREPFSLGPENSGINFVIQQVAGNTFKTLWKIPIEWRNLGSFPPRIELLEPPERNIGAPGTLTRGEVEFRSRDGLSEPVWKGKVEFYAVGREQPVETVEIEKVCAWDGARFAPLH